MDFYFVENVYLGVELGVGYTGFNYKDGERTDVAKVGTTTHEITRVAAGHKESYIGTQASLRLGWRF